MVRCMPAWHGAARLAVAPELAAPGGLVLNP
jgi:hypothetical protein